MPICNHILGNFAVNGKTKLMDPKDTGCEDRIPLASDRFKPWAVVRMAITLDFPKVDGNFCTSSLIDCCSSMLFTACSYAISVILCSQ
jgi:hypothetical protein